MQKVFKVLIILFFVFGLTAFANATLWDRGGGLIYDDDLNITWLQDANYAMTSGYDADGKMHWWAAMAWAENLVYQGYDDWRLTSLLNQDGSKCQGYNCIESEMGHLYYIELENKAGGPLNNTGPFTNLKADFYWAETPYDIPSYGGIFRFDTGAQGYQGGEFLSYALPVRDGDSAPIPEPRALLLLSSGLAGLAWIKRKFKMHS